MGNTFQRAAPVNLEANREDEEGPSEGVQPVRAQKRQHDQNEDEAEIDTLMRTPKKKRLKTTSRYIYETLFMEGRDSDIIVSALNRDWKLH